MVFSDYLPSSIFDGFDDNDHNLLTFVRRHICQLLMLTLIFSYTQFWCHFGIISRFKMQDDKNILFFTLEISNDYQSYRYRCHKLG
jgi:hypothetical protein